LNKEGYNSRVAYGLVRRVEGDQNHAWVVLNDKVLDPTSGTKTTTNDWVFVEKETPYLGFQRGFLEQRIKQGE
jgi:hypothetical protein